MTYTHDESVIGGMAQLPYFYIINSEEIKYENASIQVQSKDKRFIYQSQEKCDHRAEREEEKQSKPT